MTVKELKEMLDNYDDDMQVVYNDGSDYCYSISADLEEDRISPFGEQEDFFAVVLRESKQIGTIQD